MQAFVCPFYSTAQVTAQYLTGKPTQRNTQATICLCKDRPVLIFLHMLVCRCKHRHLVNMQIAGWHKSSWKLRPNLQFNHWSWLCFWIKMDYSRCHGYVFYLMSVIGFKRLFTLFSDVRMLRSELTILYYFNVCNSHWWDYKKIHFSEPWLQCRELLPGCK